jgi:protoporphyrinogen/coproporphyrinogen III oxidase
MVAGVTGGQEPVAVVGSGPSGLAAAFRLRQRGYVVTLFEQNRIPGGKMRTVHRDGYQIEEGPLVMSRNYVAILSLAREAGMADQIVQASAVFGFPRDGQIHTFDAGRIIRDGLTTRLLSPIDKARLSRLVIDCVRHRDLLKRSDLGALSELDRESSADYSLRKLGRNTLDYVVDPALRGLCSSPPEELSVLDLLYCFNNFLGIPRAYAFQHGMGSYAATVADEFDVRYETAVVAVEEGPDDVRVTWRPAAGSEQQASFAGCVIATPADSTRRIHVTLDDWSASFLDRVRYTPLININIALTKPPPVKASFVLTPTVLAPDVMGVILEHNKVPERTPAGRGHVVIGATAELSRKLWDVDDERCTNALIEASRRVLPLSTDDVEFGHVTRWPGVSLISPVGYYGELSRFQREQAARHKRLQLASDYFCTSNINSATAAGERAARTLAANLGVAEGARGQPLARVA